MWRWRGVQGKQAEQIFERALSTVDVTFQNVDSLGFGVTDIEISGRAGQERQPDQKGRRQGVISHRSGRRDLMAVAGPIIDRLGEPIARKFLPAVRKPVS